MFYVVCKYVEKVWSSKLMFLTCASLPPIPRSTTIHRQLDQGTTPCARPHLISINRNNVINWNRLLRGNVHFRIMWDIHYWFPDSTGKGLWECILPPEDQLARLCKSFWLKDRALKGLSVLEQAAPRQLIAARSRGLSTRELCFQGVYFLWVTPAAWVLCVGSHPLHANTIVRHFPLCILI